MENVAQNSEGTWRYEVASSCDRFPVPASMCPYYQLFFFIKVSCVGSSVPPTADPEPKAGDEEQREPVKKLPLPSQKQWLQ